MFYFGFPLSGYFTGQDYKKHLNYKRHVDWETFYQWCKAHNYRLILLTTKSQKKYYEFKYKNNDILLFGRESAGVPDDIHNIVDERLTITMVEGLRSINVSSSVAIVVSEACRQLGLFNV